MSITDRIIEKLQAEYAPLELEVKDNSEQHRGHGGYRDGGETHFSVNIVSEKFAGKNKVAAHKMIYKTLELELNERIHALEIKASS